MTVQHPTLETSKWTVQHPTLETGRWTVEHPTLETGKWTVQHPTLETGRWTVQHPTLETGKWTVQHPTLETGRWTVQHPTLETGRWTVEHPTLETGRWTVEHPTLETGTWTVEHPTLETGRPWDISRQTSLTSIDYDDDYPPCMDESENSESLAEYNEDVRGRDDVLPSPPISPKNWATFDEYDDDDDDAADSDGSIHYKEEHRQRAPRRLQRSKAGIIEMSDVISCFNKCQGHKMSISRSACMEPKWDLN
ncbi:hypothetical protein Btru_025888 [Bulinus truncatus]|nr:hypothetical protein Btru_025888 [Bulinus truncatus]